MASAPYRFRKITVGHGDAEGDIFVIVKSGTDIRKLMTGEIEGLADCSTEEDAHLIVHALNFTYGHLNAAA